jgi:hypothetical protein
VRERHFVFWASGVGVGYSSVCRLVEVAVPLSESGRGRVRSCAGRSSESDRVQWGQCGWYRRWDVRDVSAIGGGCWLGGQFNVHGVVSQMGGAVGQRCGSHARVRCDERGRDLRLCIHTVSARSLRRGGAAGGTTAMP